MSGKRRGRSKRFKSLGEFLLSLYKEGSIESEIMDKYPDVKRILKLELVKDEGDFLEITNALKGLCDLAIAFKNRELIIGEIPTQKYSWLIPLLHKSKPYPLYLPKEDSLKKVYRKFPNFVIKRLDNVMILLMNYSSESTT